MGEGLSFLSPNNTTEVLLYVFLDVINYLSYMERSHDPEEGVLTSQ